MRILCVPVLVLGVALILVGLEASFAPEVLVFSAGNRHVFELVPRIPAGLFITLTGGMMAWEGYRGSQHFLGLFLGVLASLFFAVASALPAFMGSMELALGPFILKGYINGITVVMWLTTAVLCGYYYIKLRQD